MLPGACAIITIYNHYSLKWKVTGQRLSSYLGKMPFLRVLSTVRGGNSLLDGDVVELRIAKCRARIADGVPGKVGVQVWSGDVRDNTVHV